jgi:hypothetical protein
VEHREKTLSDAADAVAHGTSAAIHWKFTLAKVEQGVGRTSPAAFVIEASQGNIVTSTG